MYPSRSSLEPDVAASVSARLNLAKVDTGLESPIEGEKVARQAILSSLGGIAPGRPIKPALHVLTAAAVGAAVHRVADTS